MDTAQQRMAQLVDQLDQLEQEHLEVPTLPGDPREQEVQEFKGLRARLGEKLHRHHKDLAQQMDTDRLLEQLKQVAPPTTYAERVVAWVYIYALIDCSPQASAAFLRWDQDAPRGEDRDQGPAVHIIGALTGEEPEIDVQAPRRHPRRAGAGWVLAVLLAVAVVVTTLTST
ncbi:hypothetical protein BQ8420_16570 [Nocardiopsis sp. JB363]|nr:hypothetical protein BQ8420_16570 [Nocardiopsis sp. JB363]